jgi:hyperosmotically inducible periplasmic protein
MFRGLLRLVVVLVILVGVGGFFLGWWGTGRILDRPVAGTTGRIDTDKAKAVGAEVAAKTAEVANKAGEVLSEGAVTAKIKSKMALDDLVKSRSIDVSTTKGIVTLRGTVASAAEHDRVVQLARETTGVTTVVDKLAVRR